MVLEETKESNIYREKAFIYIVLKKAESYSESSNISQKTTHKRKLEEAAERKKERAFFSISPSWPHVFSSTHQSSPFPLSLS